MIDKLASRLSSASGDPDATDLTLWDRTHRIGIELDDQTGLPRALLASGASGDGRRHPLQWSVTLVTEEDEVEREPYGLAYANTVDLSDFALASRKIPHEFAGNDELFRVFTAVEGWEVEWEYRFRTSSPRLEVQIILSPSSGDGKSTLRNLRLQLTFTPDNLAEWKLEAPGSAVRSGIPAHAMAEKVEVGDRYGSSGMILVHQPDQRSALLVWPFSRTEECVSQVQTVGDSVELTVETGLAGRISKGERLRYGGLELDLFDETWDELRPKAHTWLETLGISRPLDTAAWIPGSTIFEVQIGASVFWKGFEYSPYPTMRDLYNDVGRIAGLGFDCIQIMPRQPFPSYNVYDYADIETSYGDVEDLKRVVDACHALGMKVILDILLHGVIDADIIHRAADRVRNGPYFARLDEGTETDRNPDQQGYQGFDYLVAWSRHILDFEEYWAGGSPGEHPLVAEHPEWFMRGSDGEIIGVYTKAFDAANIEWQEYFTESVLNLVRELEVDGFRFDAPTYNEVPNWSPATEKRASASQLGSVELFARLRPLLKSIKPDAMLYTEPSGPLFRDTMDIVYNYDEHWLIHAVLRPEQALDENPFSIRHARDLATWIRDKEAMVPDGSMTSRHIDSHDTFWWPLPGVKWRREQYGLAATRALLATWSLIGGSYMTFVGGEVELEDDIRRMNRVRKNLPEIRIGQSDYDSIEVDDDRIFAVVRELESHVSIVLVNLSDEAIETKASLDISIIPSSGAGYQVHDVWNDVNLKHGSDYVWNADQLASFPVSFAPYQARLLTVRPAATHA